MEIYIRGISKSATVVEDIASAMNCTGREIARQIGAYHAYIMIEHDIKSAIEHGSCQGHIVSVPITVDGDTSIVYVVFEAKKDALHINMIGHLSQQLLEESATILSQAIV